MDMPPRMDCEIPGVLHEAHGIADLSAELVDRFVSVQRGRDR
jgi:hypothetical protein